MESDRLLKEAQGHSHQKIEKGSVVQSGTNKLLSDSSGLHKVDLK